MEGIDLFVKILSQGRRKEEGRKDKNLDPWKCERQAHRT